MCAYLIVRETPERRPNQLQEKAGDFDIYDVISHKNEASEILVYFCFYIFVLKSLLFLFANVLSNVPRFHQKKIIIKIMHQQISAKLKIEFRTKVQQ